ncbi:type VII secretion system-associated protein [Streptomyces sp. NPDC096311]|uniref:type VII secretion system-associated protein n=1 Tax=Streptomyces sp. NPDC096311 TaxID=3366083 RepID=UPI0037FA4929
MADFSHLDKQSVQAFIDGDLATFIGDLKHIVEKGDPSIRDLADGVTTSDTVLGIHPGQPLMMGLIGDDDLVGGALFVKSLATNLQTTLNVLEAQQDTFDEINEGLVTTLKELFKTQDDNLGTIGADEFSGVLTDTGFSDGSSGGSSDSGSGSDSSSDSGSGSDGAEGDSGDNA